MNIPSMTARTTTPSCYGKDWDKNAPECAGGPDPSFSNPKTGLSLREQCDFFQSCGVRVQAVRTAGVIPPQNLVRPPASAPTTQTFKDYVSTHAAAHIEAERQAALAGPRPPIVPTAPQWQTQQQPQTYHQGTLNYTMPGYLTTPEVRRPGESLWVVVLLEMLRGLLKGMLHAGAHAFDVRTIREK